jgi:hypothetical protein
VTLATNRALVGRPVPEKLQGRHLKAAALKFKFATTAPDGLHPRHLAHLSDEGIQALADILNAAEIIGNFPDKLQSLIIALFDKPTGGTRPIGWYRAIFRVWARARRHLWQHWERSSGENHIFGAGEGRTVSDIVWRQSVRAEINVLKKGFSGAVLFDMIKCYEYVQHMRLVREGD